MEFAKKSLEEIAALIDEARKLLLKITDSHVAADAIHARVRNLLSIAEQELKFHELDKAETASEKLVEIVRTLGATADILKDAAIKSEQSASSQEKHTKVIIIWTVVMAIATGIVAFATVCSVWVSYGQWNILSKQLESERGILSAENFFVKTIQAGQPLEIDLLGVNAGRAFAFDAKPRAFIGIYSGPFNINDLRNLLISRSRQVLILLQVLA